MTTETNMRLLTDEETTLVSGGWTINVNVNGVGASGSGGAGIGGDIHGGAGGIGIGGAGSITL